MQKPTKAILEIEDIKAIKPNFDVIKILSKSTCLDAECIAFDKESNVVYLITTNNKINEFHDVLENFKNKGLLTEVYYTSKEGFDEAMKFYDQYEAMQNEIRIANEQERTAHGLSAIDTIRQVFERRNGMDTGEFILEMVRLSFQTGASDLHFQSQEDGVLMRIRIDGVLQEILKYTHEDFRKYLQKLKFISGVKMNIDYVPQDGRFSFQAVDKNGQDKKVDARVSFMPGVGEESTVIRFLDANKGISTFEGIGFSGKNYEILKRGIEKNTGITIFTGPTGSGKTTTLYTILNYLNDGKKKIITLEDPIEYELDGIQQSQINYNKGYDYSVGLKAILRHDPDIILVGETRDKETAEISVNAALTGHSVFTTLHTNSAIESISRLTNMGLKSYMIAPSLNLVVAQRLVRRICPHCATKKAADFAERAEIEEALKKIQDANPDMNIEFDGYIPSAVGCQNCNETGYKGRFAIIEAFEITDEIKKLIGEGRNDIEIYAKARESGFLTLKEDGVLKMLQGQTTLDELRRIL